MSIHRELDFFLDLQISQNGNEIHIFHPKYIGEMLKKFQMEDYKPVSTAIVRGYKLNKNDDSKEVDQRWCRSKIGILTYVTTSRPIIMNDIGMVEIFQYGPKETHAQAIKRILWYLKVTSKFGLWYPRDGTFAFTTYSIANWVRSVDDRRNTIGCAFFLGNCLVSQFIKKQASILLSTTRAKYISVS